VRNRRELELLLGVSPLAILPLMLTRADRIKRRLQTSSAVLGTLAAFAIVLLLTHLFYRPLDVLWYEAVRTIKG